jgi:uncharacterized cupredoxin-like copper-binding protein
MRGAVFALALFLLACPHPGNETKAPQTSTTTVNPQAVPENSTRMDQVTESSKDSGGNHVPVAEVQVQIDLTEYSINMPDGLPAGKQEFQVTNHGKEQHSFVIEGPGTHQELPGKLSGGSTGTLDVDLKPGKYEVYCPVDGHKGKGMRRTITVK